MTLNQAQHQAVEHGDGPLLINATAGSGKTRVITHRAAAMIRRGVDPSRILLVTFTNKAAKEMRQRIAKLVSPEAALKLSVGTFHGTCVRLLKKFESDQDREGRTDKFVIYDQSDAEATVKGAMSELGVDPKEYKKDELASFISLSKSEGKRPDDLPDPTDDLGFVQQRVWKRYETILAANNAFDFDDLVNVVMRAAESDTPTGRWLRQKWSHVLVDEYQDTSVVQFRLSKALGSSGNLTAVGDVNQALYSWRGATPDNILKFGTEHYPTAKVVDMATNYRSTKRIVAVSNAFRSNGDADTPNQEGDLVEIRSFVDVEAEARFIASDIERRISQGVDAGECVVLYRAKVASRAIEEALRNRGLSYDVVGGLGFYDRGVVKDCLAYLRLAWNPSNNLDLERIINRPARGVGDKAVDAVRQAARAEDKPMLALLPRVVSTGELTAGQRMGLHRFGQMLDTARHELSEGRKPSEVAQKLLEASGLGQAHLKKAAELEAKRKHAEAEKERQDASHVPEVIVAIQAYEARVSNPTLGGFLEEVALITAQDDASGKKVLLSTVHGFKGLEADAVWVAAFEKSILPSEYGDSDVTEEKRVAFVALSRARKWLTLTYCEQRSINGKFTFTGPSPFLYLVPVEASRWRERDEELKAKASPVSMEFLVHSAMRP